MNINIVCTYQGIAIPLFNLIKEDINNLNNLIFIRIDKKYNNKASIFRLIASNKKILFSMDRLNKKQKIINIFKDALLKKLNIYTYINSNDKINKKFSIKKKIKISKSKPASASIPIPLPPSPMPPPVLYQNHPLIYTKASTPSIQEPSTPSIRTIHTNASASIYSKPSYHQCLNTSIYTNASASIYINASTTSASLRLCQDQPQKPSTKYPDNTAIQFISKILKDTGPKYMIGMKNINKQLR